MTTQATPYSIARAELVAKQIGRIGTQHLHQLAGHHANLGFWLSEAGSALRTIDGYQLRFKQLRDAQVSWVRDHDSKVSSFCPVCRGACEFDPQTPARPRRVPSEELEAARQMLHVAVRQLLVRLHGAGFISEAEVRQHAGLLDVSIEREDLEPS